MEQQQRAFVPPAGEWQASWVKALGPRDRVAFHLAAVTDFQPNGSLTAGVAMLLMLAVPMVVLGLAPGLAVRESVIFWAFVGVLLLLFGGLLIQALRIRKLCDRMRGLGYSWVGIAEASEMYFTAGPNILAVRDLPRAEQLDGERAVRAGDVVGLLKVLFPLEAVAELAAAYRRFADEVWHGRSYQRGRAALVVCWFLGILVPNLLREALPSAPWWQPVLLAGAVGLGVWGLWCLAGRLMARGPRRGRPG